MLMKPKHMDYFTFVCCANLAYSGHRAGARRPYLMSASNVAAPGRTVLDRANLIIVTSIELPKMVTYHELLDGAFEPNT